LAVLLLTAGRAEPLVAQDVPPWAVPACRHRRLLTAGPAAAGTQWFWLEAGGRARSDGADIALISPSGRAVPLNVFCSTAEGRHLVIAREPKPEKGAYALYFGNPGAAAVAPAPISSGLFLKTLPIPRNPDVDTWPAAERTLLRAAEPWGAAPWPQVFDAVNPFGPPADYISVYEGVIQCPKDGDYAFATLSDDASFLLIDGSLVVEWGGRRHAIDSARRGEKSGTRTLKAGPHAFKYVSFAFDGVKRCAASWKPPDRPNWEIIPASAFAPVAPMKAVAAEEQGQPVAADFVAERVSYLEVEAPQRGVVAMVAVQFSALPGPRGERPAQLKWEFGDGQTSLLPAPLHVYFAPGKYRVSLTAAAPGGAQTFLLSYDARLLWNDLEFTEAKRRRFLEWTAVSQPERMKTAHLLAYRDFLKEMSSPLRLFEVNSELDRRRGDLPPPVASAVAQEVAEYNTEPLRKFDVAEKYYLQLIESCGKEEVSRRLDLRIKLGDLYFYYLRDFDRALKTYTQVRDESPKDDVRHRRQALIRMGDVERDRKRVDDARRLYAQAEAEPSVLPRQPRPVVEGRFRQETEFHLAQGNGEAALNTLEQWLWIYPTRRLEGDTLVFRLKANLLAKNYAEVLKHADLFLSYGDDPDAVPMANLLAGRACAESGDKARARVHFQTVLDKWPESPAVKDARAALDRLK